MMLQKGAAIEELLVGPRGRRGGRQKREQRGRQSLPGRQYEHTRRGWPKKGRLPGRERRLLRRRPGRRRRLLRRLRKLSRRRPGRPKGSKKELPGRPGELLGELGNHQPLKPCAARDQNTALNSVTGTAHLSRSRALVPFTPSTSWQNRRRGTRTTNAAVAGDAANASCVATSKERSQEEHVRGVRLNHVQHQNPREMLACA